MNGKKLHNDSCEIRRDDRILKLDWSIFMKDSKKIKSRDPNSTTPVSKHSDYVYEHRHN